MAQELKGLPPVKKWFMEKIVLGFTLLGRQAQNPADRSRKFADCINGKIGSNGELLGALEGKTIGRITDQTSMNEDFTNQEVSKSKQIPKKRSFYNPRNI